MDFEQIRLIESLLLPPGGFITLGLLGALFAFTRGGRRLAFLCLLGIYLLSTPFISSWLSYQLEKQHPAIDPSLLHGVNPPQALVVLGGGYYGESVEYADTAIGPFFAERVRYAAWLSRKSGLPIIISSGTADSPAAARILQQEYGVNEVIIEKASWTTEDNVSNLKPMLQARGISKVGVITHGWHMPRAMWSFNQHLIDAMPLPMGLLVKRPGYDKYENWLPSMTSLLRSRNALHEIFGLGWYRLNALNSQPLADQERPLKPLPPSLQSQPVPQAPDSGTTMPALPSKPTEQAVLPDSQLLPDANTQ